MLSRRYGAKARDDDIDQHRPRQTRTELFTHSDKTTSPQSLRTWIRIGIVLSGCRTVSFVRCRSGEMADKVDDRAQVPTRMRFPNGRTKGKWECDIIVSVWLHGLGPLLPPSSPFNIRPLRKPATRANSPILNPSFPTSSILRSHSGNEPRTEEEKCVWVRFVYLGQRRS
jgi:hypothetical protein